MRILLFLWALIGLLPANEQIFKAHYDVSWKGLGCGVLISKLESRDDGMFVYTQSLVSSLFFYPLEQQEESVFRVTAGKLEPVSYHYYKKEFQKDLQQYDIIFKNNELSTVTEKETVVYQNTQGYLDKLLLQLKLIAILRDRQDKLSHHESQVIQLTHVDLDGGHARSYEVTPTESGKLSLLSKDGSKCCQFIVNPQQGFFLEQFIQKKRDKVVFQGIMRELVLGDRWLNLYLEHQE